MGGPNVNGLNFYTAVENWQKQTLATPQAQR